MDLQHTARRALASKYVVAGRMDTQGQSRLYRATQADTGRLVVLREFEPANESPADALANLTRIGSVASRFLADLVDAAPIDEKTLYVAHAFLNGEGLGERLARRGALAPPEGAALGARVLKGLEALHRRELVHGAIRPSRVFHERARGKGWHVKLLGAGVASIRRDEARATAALARYSPPEWLSGGAWTARGDVWCVAVILYECITKQSPFAGADDAQAIIAAAARGEFTPLGQLTKDVPSGLEQLLAESLSPDPEQRPASAGPMLDRLVEIFPQPERTSGGGRTLSHWTKGVFVGARPGAPLALPPVPESPTQVQRKQKAAVKRATSTGVAVTACAAAAVVAGLYVQAQRRERLLLSQLEQQRATASAPVSNPTSIREPSTTVPPVAPVLPPTTNLAATESADAAAPASDAGAPRAVRSVNSRAHGRHTTRDPSTPATPAPQAPPSGAGTLAFRATVPCSMVLDGATRGDVTIMELPLAAGMHQITCRSGGRTAQHLAVRIHPGRLTRVHISSTGEVEVSTEDAPSRGP